jgi:hypothetical protein
MPYFEKQLKDHTPTEVKDWEEGDYHKGYLAGKEDERKRIVEMIEGMKAERADVNPKLQHNVTCDNIINKISLLGKG